MTMLSFVNNFVVVGLLLVTPKWLAPRPASVTAYTVVPSGGSHRQTSFTKHKCIIGPTNSIGRIHSQHLKSSHNDLFRGCNNNNIHHLSVQAPVSFQSVRTALFAVPRYGPSSMIPSEGGGSSNNNINGTSDSISLGINNTHNTNEDNEDQFRRITREKQERFRSLVEECRMTTQPEHIPRLLANNIELIVSLQGDDGVQVISTILDEAKLVGEKNNDNDQLLYTHTLQTIETILSFAEDFVQHAREMDDRNKHLLGKIIKTMTKKQNQYQRKNDDDDVDGTLGMLDSGGEETAAQREESLDTILEDEKGNFSPGFLRHLEGECARIENAPTMTPESARMLELIRMIQTRVLEELGKDMGEATLVLGQLMGYDNEQELLGVLDAGLAVRGVDFAVEMANLTEEALMGFQRVHGGVEQELIDRVTLIDTRLRRFVEESNAFQ